MGKKKGRETDKAMQWKHFAPSNPFASNKHRTATTTTAAAAAETAALAMNGALIAVVEKTTTDVLKLKELDKIVLKLHCGDREGLPL